MRVYPVQNHSQSSIFRQNKTDFNNNTIPNYSHDSQIYTTNLTPINIANKIVQSEGISSITFTGGNKNMNQVLSLPYENKATGLPEDYQGGLGVVTAEAPASFRKNEGLDVRSIMPFHEYNNPKGGFKFLHLKGLPYVEETNADGKKIKKYTYADKVEARWFLSGEPGQTLEEFAKANNIKPEELRYVIQSEPSGKEATSTSKYCIIEPTNAKGEFERMSDIDIGKTKKIKYHLFKISKDNPEYNTLKNTPNYWMYTTELAKIPKPYTYGPNGNGGMEAEIINSDFCRAVLRAGEQMNTEEFGNFNPASIWGHDRPIATIFSFIADESANGNKFYDGTITHFTMHNPRRAYQGCTDNPFEFARMIFSPKDVEQIRNHPQYELLQNFNARGWENLTEVEKNFVRKAFDPFIGQFKDFFGAYNITKIAINAKKVNPNNFSIGTVSPNFDRQMKNPDMDVAPGLGGDIRQINTTSPLNGSTPANLGLDNNTANFGLGENILSDKKSGFTPLKYNGHNIEEIIENREKNAIWLTNIINEAEKEGQNTLNKVFYNDLQISQGRSVFGSISNYKKGDILLMGWGRPDEQKGFPITLMGFKKFLMREDIPKEIKQRVHMIIGWGDLPFDKKSREWNLVYKTFQEIQELDNGAYKGSLLLADGRYPNKLLGCATHCIFTSRDEICGITPFESKAGGVPYLSTAAGGPVDYTNKDNGWLTDTAPEMNPTYDGLDWNTSKDQLDDARINRSSNEVANRLGDMADEYFHNKPSYIAKCKTNIEEKFDWHNNDKFNGGISANKMYRNKIWHIDEGWDARDKAPMKRLVGSPETNAQINETTQKAILAAAKNEQENLKEIIEKTAKAAVAEIKETVTDTANSVKDNINTNIKETSDAATKDLKTTITETANSIKEELKTTLEQTTKSTKEELKTTLEQTTNTAKEELKTTFVGTVNTAKENTDKIAETAKQEAAKIKNINNKWVKTAVGVGVTFAALGTATYAYMKKNNKKLISKEKITQNNNTNPISTNTQNINKLNKTA